MNKEEIRLCSVLFGCKVSNRLLDMAFTHSSYANEHGKHSNERLEFLGDSVIALIISEYMYKTYPNKDEGMYSKVRAHAVSGEVLSGITIKLRLNKMLKTGEFMLGKNTTKLFANLFEALVGAVYIDKGLEKARFFVLRELQDVVDELMTCDFVGDYKSGLSELAQKRHEKLEFELVNRSGPDHEPVFVMAAVLDGVEMGRGKGSTKAKAQEEASRNAYMKYKEEYKDKGNGN